MPQITANDVRELLTARIMDPTLVEWLNENEAAEDVVEVVAGPLLTDISYYRHGQDYRIITTANDLRQMGDWDIENPTAEDFDAFAQMLSEG